MSDFTMVMPFIDQSDKFCQGFECGQIWEQMKMNKNFDHYLFNVKNKDQIEMMCRRFNYSFMIETMDEWWCYLTAELTN